MENKIYAIGYIVFGLCLLFFAFLELTNSDFAVSVAFFSIGAVLIFKGIQNLKKKKTN